MSNVLNKILPIPQTPESAEILLLQKRVSKLEKIIERMREKKLARIRTEIAREVYEGMGLFDLFEQE